LYCICYTCEDINEQLRKHLSGHKGSTVKKNRKIVYTENFETKSEAYAFELNTKYWKSKKRIKRLFKKLEHHDFLSQGRSNF